MIRIDQNHPFQAAWSPQHNPDRDGILGAVARKVKNILFYLPNSLVAACINPRKESRFHPSPPLDTNHGNFTKEVITPDQVHLKMHVSVGEGATPQTPTVILFNPLGANNSIHSGLKAALLARRCNVVTFNYRGLGSTWKSEDLVIDGESVYQYVTSELGTDPNQVRFYGFSLGGAIAAQVKALHPESEGKYVGDRPFRSVFSLIAENGSLTRFGCLIKKVTSFISSLLLAYPVYLLGWEWDGVKALTQLRGSWRVIYHPNDFLVPYEASLASQCPPDQVIALNANETGPSTHFAPLARHMTSQGLSAVSVTADFLAE